MKLLLEANYSLDDLELSGLRVLVALSEEGSLLRAATAIGTSRGTLRRRLAKLEAAVGLPLYIRGAERVHLTTAGALLVARSRELFSALRGTLEEVQAAADTPLRSLRMLAMDGMPPSLMVSTLQAGAARSPGMRLEMDFAADPLAEDLSAYDLILHLGPPPERGFLVTRQLLAVSEILVASRDYLEEHGTPDRPEALREHRLLSWRVAGEPIDSWVMTGGEALAVEPMVVSPDIHLIRHLAWADFGIARLLEGGIPSPEDARLVRLFPEAFARSIPVRLLIPDGLHRTPRMKMVSQLLSEMGLSIRPELMS